MNRIVRLLGSLRIAVPLLISIAVVLAWGTLYETRFGTAAVQRFVYRAWWFQALLGFLAVNLAVAAWQRYPWKRQHLSFVLAHLGIILILIGGIIGGRWGIEGQLIIPEGQAERMLQLPTNVLAVHLPAPPASLGEAERGGAQAGQPNPGVHVEIPTRFETTAWVHEPDVRFDVPIADRRIQLRVDRYYPDAVVDEQITNDHPTDNPALRLLLRHGPQEEHLWLLARDPERFGARWGEAHLFFLEPETEEHLQQLLGSSDAPQPPRGVVTIRLPGQDRTQTIPVPPARPADHGAGGDELGHPIALSGTPYTVTFKEYFADFALTEQGPVSRSDQPNNPAVALTVSGPEGTDPHLLFALHPGFDALHGRQHRIAAEIRYLHHAGAALPPNTMAFIRPASKKTLMALFTGTGDQRQLLETVEQGARYRHPWLEYEVEVVEFYPTAQVTTQFMNRSDEVKGEALHVVAQEGEARAETWLGLRGATELTLGKEPITVEYRPARRELPVVVKLLDFRKIDYPGTQMAAGFESDVEVTDPQRGIILIRKISMNNPLRYRGFSFYQSSFIPGEVETTILSVRNDPGTPLVYAGFLIVIGGVVSMFVLRARPGTPKRSARRRRVRR